MTVLLYRVPDERSEPVGASGGLKYDIFTNFPTQEEVDRILTHVRRFIPSFRGLSVNTPGWVHQLAGERPLNYTYGFGLLSESIRTTLILEGHGLDFIGATTIGLLLGANKPHAAELVSSMGFDCPRQRVICRPPDSRTVEQIQRDFAGHDMLVLRPAYEESSVGLSLVENSASAITAATHGLYSELPETMLLQEYIDGIDVTVPVIGRTRPACLPAVSLVPSGRRSGPLLFDATLKAQETGIEYATLKDQPETVRSRLYDMASAAFLVTKQRDSARMDARLTADGRCFFLEINSNPVLDPIENAFSMAQSARAIGMEVGQLVQLILADEMPPYGASPTAVGQ